MEKEGWLDKMSRGKVHRRWQRRWFVLREGVLTYYLEHKSLSSRTGEGTDEGSREAEEGANPSRLRMEVARCTVTCPPDTKEADFTIAEDGGSGIARSLHLRAESTEERQVRHASLRSHARRGVCAEARVAWHLARTRVLLRPS